MNMKCLRSRSILFLSLAVSLVAGCADNEDVNETENEEESNTSLEDDIDSSEDFDEANHEYSEYYPEGDPVPEDYDGLPAENEMEEN